MAKNCAVNAEMLALALADGFTVVEASEKAGISRRTAYRRLADPAFCQRLRDIRREILGQTIGRLADVMTRAAEKLVVLLDHKSARIQLRAARSLLDLGIRIGQAVDITDRLAVLESQMADDANAERTPGREEKPPDATVQLPTSLCCGAVEADTGLRPAGGLPKPEGDQ
ncbi:MAG TPA: hypothetical protein VNX28_15315 [Gemmataceae bacterium]|nr:hypothetical protein [Gemmataceae bacterium]